MRRRLHISLDDNSLSLLKDIAQRRRWTKSQVITAAIRALIREDRNDPLLDLSGDIDGLPPDLSRRFGGYLNETFSGR